MLGSLANDVLGTSCNKCPDQRRRRLLCHAHARRPAGLSPPSCPRRGRHARAVISDPNHDHHGHSQTRQVRSKASHSRPDHSLP
ncbi:hypothetical protein B0T18DRAFT_228384 [Schizothecium vesticola]|uniref:Uncharacterized protein n=1 Tax=Schizothecium vesticola TaxID=314040 RepID=A0AA40EL05_9PEZI|nr:hypothetical protein B0T18DRAFT_228384 [Schizothecium vesticola]